jgi:NTP pyrophosphatase (non-canonical NTP hydrolase)
MAIITDLAIEIHETAKKHGWWESERNDGECIALMHSELSECLEALRHGNPKDEHIPEHNNAVVELADCIIRILDFAQSKGWSIEGALYSKMNYNKKREYKHGGKKF